MPLCRFGWKHIWGKKKVAHQRNWTFVSAKESAKYFYRGRFLKNVTTRLLIWKASCMHGCKHIFKLKSVTSEKKKNNHPTCMLTGALFLYSVVVLLLFTSLSTSSNLRTTVNLSQMQFKKTRQKQTIPQKFPGCHRHRIVRFFSCAANKWNTMRVFVSPVCRDKPGMLRGGRVLQRCMENVLHFISPMLETYYYLCFP